VSSRFFSLVSGSEFRSRLDQPLAETRSTPLRALSARATESPAAPISPTCVSTQALVPVHVLVRELAVAEATTATSATSTRRLVIAGIPSQKA
jgi:hypothetical protein